MEKKKMLICDGCDFIRRHEDDLKCFKNETVQGLKCRLDTEILKDEKSVLEKIADIGKNALYNYLTDIQHKQICRGWCVGKGYIYRERLYIDEYGVNFDQYNEFRYVISSLTVYPFLMEVETSTVKDPKKRNLYVDSGLNSDIYSLIYYDQDNCICQPCGWISCYELMHGSFKTISNDDYDLIVIPQSELCPNFYALLHHPPKEYQWQCKTSKAHQIVGSILYNANNVSNPPFLGTTSFSLIRTDYWAKEVLFEAINSLHKKLHFLGYNDDEIINETVSIEDQKLAVRALIREFAKKRGCEQLYHNMTIDLR